jgi:hypothetical protein
MSYLLFIQHLIVIKYIPFTNSYQLGLHEPDLGEHDIFGIGKKQRTFIILLNKLLNFDGRPKQNLIFVNKGESNLKDKYIYIL